MISVHISLYTVLAKLTQKTYMLLHLHQPQYFFSIHINIIFLSPTPTQFLAKKKTCQFVAPTNPNHQATTNHPKEPPTTQTNHYVPKSLQPPRMKIFFTFIIKPKFYLII